MLDTPNNNLRQVGNSEDLRIEVIRRGKGSPLLLLAGEEQLEADAPFLAELARQYEIIMPSPPGFGRSTRPDWISNPDDISYIYLELVDDLGLRDVPVLGFSLGGWIAAEMASKDDGFMSKLVLVDAYGIKTGGPTDRDITDVWFLSPDEVMAVKWFDIGKGKRDFPSMSDEALTIVARNTESFARFCWEPYMHNPKLKHRLHRIKTPSLLVWGENDGIVTPRYGQTFCNLIPNARMTVIPQAGHLPHIEQPETFLEQLRGFLA